MSQNHELQMLRPGYVSAACAAKCPLTARTCFYNRRSPLRDLPLTRFSARFAPISVLLTPRSRALTATTRKKLISAMSQHSSRVRTSRHTAPFGTVPTRRRRRVDTRRCGQAAWRHRAGERERRAAVSRHSADRRAGTCRVSTRSKMVVGLGVVAAAFPDCRLLQIHQTAILTVQS